MEDADLLIHLVDISNPRFDQHIESVESILKDLNLADKPKLLVFNKVDKVATGNAANIVLATRCNGCLGYACRKSPAPLGGHRNPYMGVAPC